MTTGREDLKDLREVGGLHVSSICAIQEIYDHQSGHHRPLSEAVPRE